MTTQKAQLALAIFLGATVISGCGVGEASVADADTLQAATPVPVEVSSPVRDDIFATFDATATIGSDTDAPAVARVAGQVVSLSVEEGELVAEGQVLARLDGERLKLEMLAARANLERVEKEYERNRDLHERGLVSAAMYEGLRFDLDALRATYDLARLNYEYSAIRAPIAGVVSSREIKPGENLVPGQVAFRITDTSELIAYLQIPQAELSKFTVGDTATVEVASMPGSRFAATVARISPTIDVDNGTFRITAKIDNSAGNLAPGMFGRFSIAWDMHEDALVIPAHALLDEDDEAAVYVVTDGEVSRRVVETGIETEGRIEIVDGLAEDEEIVVVGHSALRDGARVLASTVDRDSYAG